jgi:hypothetical protein
MELMEFFRTEQFANEVAKELNKSQIQLILKKGKEFLEFATHIKNNCLYFDYEVTPDTIDLGDGTAKTEYRLQQMWQGSGGTENWIWVEYVD